MRRFDDARKQTDLALELDPYNPLFRIRSANEFIDRGHTDEALVEIDRVAALAPQRTAAIHFIRFRAYHRKGQYEQALEHLKNFYGTDPEVVQALERGYSSGGYKLALISAANVVVANRGKGERVAQIYAAAGADNRALDCLEAAFQAGAVPVSYANARAEFEHLRSNPRFQALMRSRNLPQ